MIEYWDLYDKNFIKLDGYSHIRGRRIPKGYYHLVVNTIVKSGEYFLFMKRDLIKLPIQVTTNLQLEDLA